MAVMIAVMAVVLFGVSALAVDLGNAWSRGRAVQKQADVTATSAGWRLPMRVSVPAAAPAAIAADAARYLNANRAPGQPVATGSALLDGQRANGEVSFEHADGTACTDVCVQMEVVAPAAHVEFGLAGVLGRTAVDVQRVATVRVVSPLPSPADMVPFWLPDGCALGPAAADTTGGNSLAATTTTTTVAPSPTPSPTPGPTPSPTSSPTATASGSGGPAATASPSPTTTTATAVASPGIPVGSHRITSPRALSVTVGQQLSVSQLQVDSIPSNTDRASIRFYSPDGSTYVDYAAQDVGKTNPLVVPTFTVGGEVSATPGTWRVYALIQAKGNARLEISANHLDYVVVGPSPSPTPGPTPTASPSPSPSAGPSPTQTASPTATPTTTPTATPTPEPAPSPTGVPVGCVGQDRGNFGQLDSPRRDGLTGQRRLAANIAGGLDHQLVPYSFAVGQTVTKECGSGSSWISGAVPDDQPLDGRNCILGDTGNDGPALYDGFVSGTGSRPGRLDVRNGATTCPGRGDLVVGSVRLNNDVLSCFLRNGATLDSLTRTGVSATMLAPEVVDSPRLVWLPVVYATDRAQKRFQPILDFVPGFLTDETQSSAASASNGLAINGNSVKALQVFVFDKAALPVDAQAPTVAYDADLGPSIVRLVG